MKANGCQKIKGKTVEITSTVYKNREDFMKGLLKSMGDSSLNEIFEYYSQQFLEGEMFITESNNGEIVCTELFV